MPAPVLDPTNPDVPYLAGNSGLAGGRMRWIGEGSGTGLRSGRPGGARVADWTAVAGLTGRVATSGLADRYGRPGAQVDAVAVTQGDEFSDRDLAAVEQRAVGRTGIEHGPAAF